MWTVGIDVGGTFTDLYATRTESDEARTAKVLTTPADRVEGVVTAIEVAGIAPKDISLLVHGTTTATNALIERDFPNAAMVTTEGFRDVIEIGRMHREHLYRPYQVKPEPLIRRRFRYVIEERVTANGDVERPVNLSDLDRIIAEIRKHDIRSVVVCLINSYANAHNENAVADYLRMHLEGVPVVTSAEVKPIFREHTRFSTAVVRTVLLPVMADYFTRLETAMARHGFTGSLMILKSNGGMMSIGQAKSRVEELVESGPAGGIGYAAEISSLTGIPNVIHTDVGGTSFDASIVENGRGLVTRNYEIEFDIPVAVPMLDIRSIGAGGGSVGWLDSGGSLRVGPRSAGSVPGPACYGRGGTLPTITDANLVLGRLSPDLSGKFKLDVDAAQRAIESLASPLGISVEQCAEGMIRIATEAMAQSVKIVLASRGRDPRDYALASFGGAGPMHAGAIAAALSIPRVIVPRYSGVASAFGATRLKLKHDEEMFHFSKLNAASLADIAGRFERLKERAVAALLEQGASRQELSSSHIMRMRYAGQTFEVDVPQNAATIASGNLEAATEAFHCAHALEFGVRSNDFPVEVVALSVTVEGPATGAARGAGKSGTPSANKKIYGRRKVFFDGAWHDASVHASEPLAFGTEIEGPAIIEDPHTCIVVPPGWVTRKDKHQNFILEIRHEEQ